MNTVIRIIKHAESYEVRVSRFFYFDDNPGRRSINNRMSPKEAEEAACPPRQIARYDVPTTTAHWLPV